MAVAAFLLLSVQFVRPVLTGSTEKTELQAPDSVKQILKTSCYDCHSNETRLAWFDRIAPAYWLVVRDVRSARKHLNFSELATQPKARQRTVLFEAVNHIQMGAMPLASYRWMHPQAVITPRQIAMLRDYLSPSPVTPPSDPDRIVAATAQYRQWLAAAGTERAVRAAPNGIEFIRGYKSWKAISSTVRNDTKTLKLILGNDIAISAISQRTINPWPNGSILAKVSWLQETAENGGIQPGEFLQVAFMIKDDKRYSSSAGWGWAEWLGAELKPYGASAEFAAECVACHDPLRSNDYVYSFPIPSPDKLQ